MLIDILKEMNSTCAFSKKSLANKFKTTESVICHLLNNLKRMGYIENVQNTCCNKCKNCSLSCSKNSNNILYITKKGKNLLLKYAN